MPTVSRIEIDLSTVARNVDVLRRLVGPRCEICAVVKADAYGLGAPRLARTLIRAGAGMLAVYTARQAAAIIRAAVDAPILVLMPVRQIDRRGELYRGLVRGALNLSLHDEPHLEDLAALSERFAVTIPVHLEVDTGLGRGGCTLAEAPHLLRRLAATPRLRLAGLYTHFVAADTDARLTSVQDRRLQRMLEEHAGLIPPDCLVHTANTCATLRSASYHRSMVRVGQAWAGYGPQWMSNAAILGGAGDLQPSVTWSSHLAAVRRVPAGTCTGAEGSWTATRDSVVGLVPVGTADGFPSFSTTDSGVAVAVSLDGRDESERRFAPLIGRIGSHRMMIDLTDVAYVTADGDAAGALGAVGTVGAIGAIGVGTPVELITPDPDAPNHLARIAAAAGINPHEVLCRMSPGTKRVYRSDAPVVEITARSRTAAIAG